MARPFLAPFRRLLRLAGSRWRYSTPPPYGFDQLSFFISTVIHEHLMKRHKATTPTQLYFETEGRPYEAEPCCEGISEHQVAVKNSHATGEH
jgi:hypothetical protein